MIPYFRKDTFIYIIFNILTFSLFILPRGKLVYANYHSIYLNLILKIWSETIKVSYNTIKEISPLKEGTFFKRIVQWCNKKQYKEFQRKNRKENNQNVLRDHSFFYASLMKNRSKMENEHSHRVFKTKLSNNLIFKIFNKSHMITSFTIYIIAYSRNIVNSQNY